MAIKLIPQQALQDRYPIGYTSPHAVAYGQFCNRMYALLQRQGIDDVNNDEWREVAINLTLYLEDVLADVGIWRAFTDKMREMYGRWLPFYDIDEDDYYRDEPNLQDVQFLLWDSISRLRVGRMLNPQNPMLKEVAATAFELMMDCFETLPVNESLKALFVEARFMDDVYEMRDMLHWIACRCYLTDNGSAKEMMEAGMDGLEEELAGDDSGAYGKVLYGAACMVVYEWKGGPLALRSKDWLSAILRCNGHEAAANDVEAQEYRKVSAYAILGFADGVYTLAATDGMQLSVPRANLGRTQKRAHDAKVLCCSLIHYRGQWYPNGFEGWLDDAEAFEKQKEHDEQERNVGVPHYDKIIKNNGGSKLFFFKDMDAMIDFEKNKMGVPNAQLQRNNVSPELRQNNWTLFLPGEDQPMQIFPNIAQCICAKHNPFYNKEIAKHDAFGAMVSKNSDFALYLVENNLVPDAALNSFYGYEHGRQLLHDNFDFILRTMFREEF